MVAASSVLAVCFLLVWKAWLAPARSPTVAATTPPLVQGTSLPSSSETREAPAPPSPPPSSSSLDPEQPADRPPDAPPSAPVAGDLPGPKGTTDRSKKGALNINAAPQASVLLDGKPVGRTPQIGLPVDPGKHTVVFVFADGRQKKQTVIVGPGQTVTAVAWDDPTGGVVTPGFN
ncbi:MAG: hypothetical protein R3B70_39740 [Polyangiaceae bacterium]